MKIILTKIGRGLILLTAGIFALPAVYAAAEIEPDAQKPDITVSGIVRDAADGSPLAGVVVLDQATSRTKVTGADGSYSITVSPDASLSFSLIGYLPQTVAVEARSTVDVLISVDVTAIEAVSVVELGYGNSQRKQDLSMSVSTVRVDKVAKGRTSDLATVLQGKVPGMTIQMSGDPMKGSGMTIRGRGSKGDDGDDTNAGGILIVVDGVPGAPYMVEDIETVTVLKDAASSAIYGAQAGQGGVILITTKRAYRGAAQVSVNISNGVKTVSNLPDMMTSAQFNETWRKAYDSAGRSDYPEFANPASAIYPWTNATRTDWLDEIYRPGRTQHYGVSVSGGSENLTSIMALSYDQEDGVLLNTYSKAFSGRLQSEYRINDWAKVSQRVNFLTKNGQGGVNTNHQGPMMSAMWMPRSATVWETDINGNYVLDAAGNKMYGGLYPASISVAGYPKNVMNPVAELEELRKRFPEMKLYSTTSLEVKPVEAVTLRSDFTAYMHHHDLDEAWPIRKEAGSYTRNALDREEILNRDNGWLWETTANWVQTFGKHNISAMAGWTMKFDKTHMRGVNTYNYASLRETSFLWSNTENKSANISEAINLFSQTSLIGRVGYSYDGRYFATASVRRDGSSRLPKANRYQLFPAVSASWKISSESFMKDQNVFDLLKLRGSWGRIGDIVGLKSHEGNAYPEKNDFYAIFGQDANNLVYGTYYKRIPNPDLRWEYTDQWGVGLDAAFLDDRLDISVDYYDKTTDRLIAPMPLSDQSGLAVAPSANIGTVNNRGWELSLAFGDATRGGLRYNVWGMVSTNRSEVTNLGSWVDVLMNSQVNVNSTTLVGSQVGHPLYSFYLYQTEGIFRSQSEIDSYLHSDGTTKIQPNAKPGDIKFLDVNKDGKITTADRVLRHNYQPRLTFSFGGSVEYKGFDLSVMLQGVAGNHIYNGLRQLLSSGRYEGGNLSTEVLDSYDFNPDGGYPRLGILTDNNGNYNKMSNFFLEKGDYLRLKNLTLGYTLPSSAMQAIGLPSAGLRVYFSADNLLTFTKYSGIDPEVAYFGVDRGSYPVARLLNFGVNINF